MLRKSLLFLCLCLPLLSFTGKKKKKAQPPAQQSSGTGGAAATLFPQKQDKRKSEDPQTARWNVDYRQPGTAMPPIKVVTADGRVISNKTVENDANLILMFFNPTCEHCEDMTVAMEKNIFLFKKTKVVLLAGAMMGPYLEAFQKVLKTDQFPTLQIGLDSAQTIDKCYNYESLPQLNIYGPDRKLIRVLNGITTIDSLKQYIQ